MADNQDFGFFGKHQPGLRDISGYVPPPSPHQQAQQQQPQKLTLEGLQPEAPINEPQAYATPQPPVTPIQNTPPLSANPAAVFGAPANEAATFRPAELPAAPEQNTVPAPSEPGLNNIPSFSAIFGNKPANELPESPVPAPAPAFAAAEVPSFGSFAAPAAKVPTFAAPTAEPVAELPTFAEPDWQAAPAQQSPAIAEPATPAQPDNAAVFNALPEETRFSLGAASYAELGDEAKTVFDSHVEQSRTLSTAVKDTLDALTVIRAEEATSGVDKIEATALSVLLEHASLSSPQENVALQVGGYDLLRRLADTLPDSEAKDKLVQGASTLLEVGFIQPVSANVQTAIANRVQSEAALTQTFDSAPETAFPATPTFEAEPAFQPAPEYSAAPEYPAAQTYAPQEYNTSEPQPVTKAPTFIQPEAFEQSAAPQPVPSFTPNFAPQFQPQQAQAEAPQPSPSAEHTAASTASHAERVEAQRSEFAHQGQGPRF